MRVLALDTTTRAGSLALAEDGRVILERVGDTARSQTERLPSDLLAALRAVGWSTTDVDLYAVASGPGSFTGVRTGIATIQGLAFVHGKRVAAVSALQALGDAAASGVPVGTRVGAWMDGHRREVFSALFDVSRLANDGSALLTDVEGATAAAPADTLARWQTLGLPGRLCGDGAVLYQSLVPASVQVVAPPALASFIARLAFRAAAAGDTHPPGTVLPFYVRRPDVELARDAARREP